MRGPNPFTELLFRFLVNHNNSTTKWTHQEEALAMAVLKMSYHNGSPVTYKKLVKKVDAIKSATANSLLFVEVLKNTLLKYRNHEDQLRYFDFVIRSAKNDEKSDNTELRKAQPDFETPIEVIDRLLESSKTGYKIKMVDLFDDTLKLDDIKKRVRKFHKQLRLTTFFVEQFYFDLNDGHPSVDEVMAFKSGFTVLNNKMTAALSTNRKDQILLDCCLYLVQVFFENHFDGKDVKRRLDEVNTALGIIKGSSPENVDRINRSASKYIKESKSLTSLYKKLL